MKPSLFRKFLFFKLPIAFLAGLKLEKSNSESCSISVKLSKLNSNPFQSMFWAVQGMAAELSSGVICLYTIKESKQSVSMLVVEQKAQFYKKAKGKITFTCEDGKAIQTTIQEAIETGEGKTVAISSKGFDEENDLVSEFFFTWSFKLKKK